MSQNLVVSVFLIYNQLQPMCSPLQQAHFTYLVIFTNAIILAAKNIGYDCMHVFMWSLKVSKLKYCLINSLIYLKMPVSESVQKAMLPQSTGHSSSRSLTTDNHLASLDTFVKTAVLLFIGPAQWGRQAGGRSWVQRNALPILIVENQNNLHIMLDDVMEFALG